jgi:succinate-semialdehyde dehydrogenase/glutarate-semialdehyde dehydrogenase
MSPTIEYAVTNPATGETVKRYDAISDDELRDAVGRAHLAHEDWNRSTSVKDRAEIIRRVGELHEERKQELGEIIVREMGKPIEQAVGEVEFCKAIYDFFADNAEELLADEEIKLLDGDGRAFVRKSSYGLLLGIMPWNYPYYQVARFAGPNLVIGNTVLLKHAPQCPESAAAMEQIFHDAGVPEDAYINIYASHEQVESIIADPRVRGVSLTGSERAGAAVAEIAGRHLKKVVLELGGSDPFILLGTQDLDGASSRPWARGWRTRAGLQRRQALHRRRRALRRVPGALHEGADRRAARDPHSPETTVGPLSSSGATERLAEQVRRAVDKGAKLVAGGDHEGNFFPATILTDIREDNPARHEEFFGPVAQIYRVKDEEEAVRLANDTPYGLGSYVMTNDEDQALRVADQDRRRDGLRQRGRRRGRGAAVRRREELGLRPRARPLRHGRVRQQEAHPRRGVAGAPSRPVSADRPAPRSDGRTRPTTAIASPAGGRPAQAPAAGGSMEAGWSSARVVSSPQSSSASSGSDEHISPPTAPRCRAHSSRRSTSGRASRQSGSQTQSRPCWKARAAPASRAPRCEGWETSPSTGSTWVAMSGEVRMASTRPTLGSSGAPQPRIVAAGPTASRTSSMPIR